MTMRIRIIDPTVPAGAPAGATLKETLDALHDNPTVAEYDLDDPENFDTVETWADWMMTRILHLEEGETLTITCIERVDPDDPAPFPAPELSVTACPECGERPIRDEGPEGYFFECPCCRRQSAPAHSLRQAVAAWNGTQGGAE